VGNRTDWPIAGGSVSLDLHHAWTYVFINLGVGLNTSNFNVSLTPQFLNVTGNGTYCIPVLPVPASVGATDGMNATLQVATSGAAGNALYNVSFARVHFKEFIFWCFFWLLWLLMMMSCLSSCIALLIIYVCK
jgi:hypothetical protein